jgi:uncharacterized protein YlaI
MAVIDLEILTDDPGLVRLCQEYWATDKEGQFAASVKALAAQHGLQVTRVSKLVSRNSIARATDLRCDSCGAGRVLSSRQDLTSASSRWNPRSYICPDCRIRLAHEEEERREAQLLQRRRTLQDQYQIQEGTSLDPKSFSLKEVVGLLALLRSSEHLLHEGTLPISKRDDVFAPTKDYGIELIRDLFDARLIYVHPDSPIDAFVWRDEEPNEFYLSEVSYYLEGQGSVGDRASSFEREATRFFRDGQWPAAWIEEWEQLWTELAVQECVGYLQLCLAEHDLTFAAGPKTISTFNDLLQTFSIGQIYSFIWRSAKDSIAYFVREGVPRPQAANSSIGRIQRMADRARASNWDVSNYRRNPRLPVSEVSHIFFTVAMKIPDLNSGQLSEASPPAITVDR